MVIRAVVTDLHEVGNDLALRHLVPVASKRGEAMPHGLSPSIRPSSDGDLAAITAIYAHHVRHGTGSFETEAPDVAEMARRRAAVLEAGHPHVVAEETGQVVGYAYTGAYRPRAAYGNTVETSIYLHPDALGRGLGTLLLDALVRACEAQGFRQMVAVVGDSANHASIRLHERHGFRRIGILEAVGYKHGRWLDVVLLQRQLGAGASSPPALSAS